jgi:hypothetical protein
MRRLPQRLYISLISLDPKVSLSTGSVSAIALSSRQQGCAFKRQQYLKKADTISGIMIRNGTLRPSLVRLTQSPQSYMGGRRGARWMSEKGLPENQRRNQYQARLGMGREKRNDAQLTLLIAISAFAILSIYFRFQTQNIRKRLPGAQTLYEGDGEIIRSTPKTLVIEILFIGWFDAISLLCIARPLGKFARDGPQIRVVDGHPIHATSRVSVLCGPGKSY